MTELEIKKMCSKYYKLHWNEERVRRLKKNEQTPYILRQISQLEAENKELKRLIANPQLQETNPSVHFHIDIKRLKPNRGLLLLLRTVKHLTQTTDLPVHRIDAATYLKLTMGLTSLHSEEFAFLHTIGFLDYAPKKGFTLTSLGEELLRYKGVC